MVWSTPKRPQKKVLNQDQAFWFHTLTPGLSLLSLEYILRLLGRIIQGEIDRFHMSMKNGVKLNNYYFPEHLRTEIDRFVEYYNNRRYHESLNNVKPADVYFGRNHDIEIIRKETKWRTLRQRNKQNLVLSLLFVFIQV